jgi:hypothetical protein
MTGFHLAVAASILIAGVLLGVLIVMCIGIRREDRKKSLTKDTDSHLERGVRRLNGAHTRGYGLRTIAADDDSYDEAA